MNKHIRRICTVGLAILMVASCKKKENNPEPINNGPNGQKYFIAAEQGGGTYMLTVDDLESGTTTTIGNGIENPNTYTHYASNGTIGVVGLAYRQGNPGAGIAYELDENGNLAPVGNEFELRAGFSTVGSFGQYILTARSGQTLSDGTTGSTMYFIDLNNQNTVSEKTLTTTNLTGNGKEVNFIGIVDAGNGEFLTGLEITDGHPDSVFVAKLDANLNVKQIYKDNRLSYSGGRWKSARYSQIGNDASGNTYVFSGSYDGTTTKPAGALLIRQGSSSFDPSYYFNIESQSGGYRFRKVWHISEDYFLLEFYNETVYTSNTPATQYAVVQMGTNKFQWINGLPAKDAITDAGWPFADNGKAYFPITTADGAPAVYVIDPKTATAKKGIVVEGAASIGGLARLTY